MTNESASLSLGHSLYYSISGVWIAVDSRERGSFLACIGARLDHGAADQKLWRGRMGDIRLQVL